MCERRIYFFCELLDNKCVITLLKPIGHCFGVLKAIEIAKETRKKYQDKNIYVFGLLVHNEEVVKSLEENNITKILLGLIKTVNGVKSSIRLPWIVSNTDLIPEVTGFFSR